MKVSQMKNAGLPDEALKRVKAQLDEGNGDKPTVTHIEKYAMDIEGGNDRDYKDFVFASDPASIMPDAVEMTGGQLALYILEQYETPIWDYMDRPPEVEALGEPEDYPGGEDEYYEKMDALIDAQVGEMSVDDVERIILDHLDIGTRDNTYNWSWWGPTIVFQLLGPASPDKDGEPYSEGVLIMSMHLGGDVRGNYGAAKAFKLESYAEDAPWYRYRLAVRLQTDRGDIALDAEDDEGYHFYVAEDQTGTWEEGDNVSARDLESQLEWAGLDLWWD